MCQGSRCAEPHRGPQPPAQLRTPPRSRPGPAHRGGHSPVSWRGQGSLEAGVLRGRLGPGRARGSRCPGRGWGGRRGRGGAPACRQRSPGGRARAGAHGERGRGAGVALPPAAPFNSGPAPSPAPRQSARPPARHAHREGGQVRPPANGRRAGRGRRAPGGAARPMAGVLLKLKILLYANRGGARGRGAGGTRAYKGARDGRALHRQVLCARGVPARPLQPRPRGRTAPRGRGRRQPLRLRLRAALGPTVR